VRFIYIINLTFLLLSSQPGLSQNCISDRYINDIFPNVTVTTDIYYGSSPVWTIPYNDEDHYFDFYEPTGDVLMNRPLIVFMHGGAFLGGWKAQPEIVDYAEAMAKKGFTVASISYRLGFNLLSTASAERAVYRAIQDGKSAIRFFKENHTTYGIDTTLIFMAGNSAGSISALHAGYLEESERPASTYGSGTPDLGCLDCTGNSFVHNSNPAALVNMWGAIMDVNIIDTYENVPFISFHGDNDDIVSPDVDNPFNYPLFPALHGANPLQVQANALSIMNEKHLFPGLGHEPWTNSGILDFIIDESAHFLYDYIKPAAPIVTGGNAFCQFDSSIFFAQNIPGANYCWSAVNANLMSTSANLATFQFTALGPDTITLIIENENGAISESTDFIINVSASPSLSILNLPPVLSTFSPITLSATPAGGTFSGPGMISSTFSPALVGTGLHSISYSYQNGACLETISQDVFIISISYNFATYQSSTISP